MKDTDRETFQFKPFSSSKVVLVCVLLPQETLTYESNPLSPSDLSLLLLLFEEDICISLFLTETDRHDLQVSSFFYSFVFFDFFLVVILFLILAVTSVHLLLPAWHVSFSRFLWSQILFYDLQTSAENRTLCKKEKGEEGMYACKGFPDPASSQTKTMHQHSWKI